VVSIEAVTRRQETSAHWGTYVVEVSADDRDIVAASAHPDDPDAAPAIGNVVGAHRHRSRVVRPSVRRRWLEDGPRPDAGRGDPGAEYVEVGWDTALDLLAGELDRVRSVFGNQAIFGGSYGWGSAGRLHHAQNQLHRFLNTIGGCTRSVNVLTRDVGTSTLTQATSGAHVLVAVTRHDGPVPPVRAYEPPLFS
jgi:biotin/methionine sulfoxide reductase